MKQLILKATSLKGGETNATYADFIRVVVNTPPREGMNAQEIKDRLRILQALDALPKDAEPVLSLEDADASKLQGLVGSYSHWSIVHEAIQNFTNDVANMKQAA